MPRDRAVATIRSPIDLDFRVDQQEARDAARLAVQSAVAAAVTFFTLRTLGLAEEFVGVLSGVLVVQPSVGNTFGAASDRVLATLVGCAIGLVCLGILPSGYGTAAALALAMLAMGAVAALRPAWRYGVVAAVALALGSEEGLLQTAIDRSTAIAIGSAIGALTSLCVWPDRGEARARRQLRDAFGAIAEILAAAVSRARSGQDAEFDENVARYHARLASAREAADGIRWGDSSDLQDELQQVDRLYNSVIIVRRVAEESEQVTITGRFADLLTEQGRSICSHIERMANPDAVAKVDEWSAIEKALEQARQDGLEPDSADGDQLRQSALVFGLKEVVEQLRAIDRIRDNG